VSISYYAYIPWIPSLVSLEAGPPRQPELKYLIQGTEEYELKRNEKEVLYIEDSI